MSKVKVKCHQFPNISSVPVGHIPTKLHQFLTHRFRDFLQTDAQAHRQTDATKNNTCSQHSWRAGKNKPYNEVEAVTQPYTCYTACRNDDKTY